MESPNKRMKLSEAEAEEDFVSFGGDDEDEKAKQFGYDGTNDAADVDISAAPRGPRAMYQSQGPHSHHDTRNDPRHDRDRPKSAHPLPNHSPWLLVKTKLHRRFVHNTTTKESFWHIPQDLMPAVLELEEYERLQKEKEANAKWAEKQLTEMRGSGTGSNAVEVDESKRSRRRRSESLQREDEEAMMAELAAEAEKAEEEDVREVVDKLEPLKPVVQKLAEEGGGGYDSDSSYEEVEVTDSEFEDEDGEKPRRPPQENGATAESAPHDDGPVEFGEDDIAYQLAAMNPDYDLDPGSGAEEEYDDYADDQQTPDDEEAADIFREMLTDHNISPFTPWDRLISDNSSSSIVLDDRYTALPNTRTRKAVWEAWVRDTAQHLQQARQNTEKLDPKIPYLAFLDENASTKLYWPEFKRKYRKEDAMTDRNLSDKEREKLYREHVRRLKLPESTRKADLLGLLKSIPLSHLNRGTALDDLPPQIRSNLYYISLSPSPRDEVIRKHVSTLPPAPDDGEVDAVDDIAKQEARRKREEAFAARERQVADERRKAEKEGRWAKRELLEEERKYRV